MWTLRAFVAGVSAGKPVAELKDCAFSKPDRISDTLELRRLSVPGGKHGGNLLPEKCDTDFYELYWHHLMQGTTWHSVLKWLLYWLRHPEKLNDRLYRIWKRVAAAAGLVALAVVAIVVAAIAWPELRLWELEVAIPVSLLLVAPLVWAVLKWPLVWRVEHIVLGDFGDAARYLSPDPPNVGARRAIRTAGLELLCGDFMKTNYGAMSASSWLVTASAV